MGCETKNIDHNEVVSLIFLIMIINHDLEICIGSELYIPLIINFDFFHFAGLIMSLVIYIMMFSDHYKPIATALRNVFEFIPHFTITYSLSRYSAQVLANNYCKLNKPLCEGVLKQINPCCREYYYYYYYYYDYYYYYYYYYHYY